MKMRIFYLLTFCVAVGLAAYLWRTTSFGLESEAGPGAQNLETTREEVLIIGSIGTVDEVEAFLADAQEALAIDVADMGVKEVQMIAIEEVSEAARMLRQGRLDIFIGDAFEAYLAATLAEGHVVLSDAHRTSAMLQTAESGVDSPAALAGGVIAFDSLADATEFQLMKSELALQGIEIKSTHGNTPTDPSVIGYYFAETEAILLDHVKNDVADAGVFSAAYPELKTIFSTREIPGSLVVVRDDLDVLYIQRISSALRDLNFIETSAGDLQTFEELIDFLNLELLNLEE